MNRGRFLGNPRVAVHGGRARGLELGRWAAANALNNVARAKHALLAGRPQAEVVRFLDGALSWAPVFFQVAHPAAGEIDITAPAPYLGERNVSFAQQVAQWHREASEPRNVEMAAAQLALVKACREETERCDRLEARLQRLEPAVQVVGCRRPATAAAVPFYGRSYDYTGAISGFEADEQRPLTYGDLIIDSGLPEAHGRACEERVRNRQNPAAQQEAGQPACAANPAELAYETYLTQHLLSWEYSARFAALHEAQVTEFQPYLDASAQLQQRGRVEQWPASVTAAGQRALRPLRGQCLLGWLKGQGLPASREEFAAAEAAERAMDEAARPRCEAALAVLLASIPGLPNESASAPAVTLYAERLSGASETAITRRSAGLDYKPTSYSFTGLQLDSAQLSERDPEPCAETSWSPAQPLAVLVRPMSVVAVRVAAFARRAWLALGAMR